MQQEGKSALEVIIDEFIYRVLTEGLLCAQWSSRSLGYINEQKGKDPCPHGAGTFMGCGVETM